MNKPASRNHSILDSELSMATLKNTSTNTDEAQFQRMG